MFKQKHDFDDMAHSITELKQKAIGLEKRIVELESDSQINIYSEWYHVYDRPQKVSLKTIVDLIIKNSGLKLIKHSEKYELVKIAKNKP